MGGSVRDRPRGAPSCSAEAGERGQVSVLLVVVVALVMVAAVVLVEVGSAAVHRARARTAADAAALAGAVDRSAAVELGTWYLRSGVDVVGDGGFAQGASGPSRASAWASTAPGEIAVAPAVVAVVSRAAQLLGTDFSGARMRGTSVTVDGAAADALTTIAAELGLCPVHAATRGNDTRTFELC